MIRRGTTARLASLALAALGLSSCSFIASFVVVNRSDAPLEVQYTFKGGAGRACCAGDGPARLTLKELEGDRPWKKLQEGEYFYNSTAGSVAVVLRPGEALLVERAVNFVGHGPQPDPDFRIGSVRLTGASGTVFYEGLQAQTAFAEDDSNLYALTYR